MTSIMYVCDYRLVAEKYCPVLGRNVQMKVREFGLNNNTQVHSICREYEHCRKVCGGCGNIYKNNRIR